MRVTAKEIAMTNTEEKTATELAQQRQPHKVVHVDDLEWKKIRWPGEWGKVAFHPREEDPTEPLAGITRFEAGGWFPDHAHDFAQFWYIMEGECTVNGEKVTAGSFVFHPDPHVERELKTETGVTIVFCQYPGPNTAARPIYKDRFDLDERRDVGEESTTV